MKLLIALAILATPNVLAQQDTAVPTTTATVGQGAAEMSEGKKDPKEQQELEPLAKKGFSKSDCKGFFTHEELPYKVAIEAFKATRTTVNGPTDVVMELRYQGSISHGEVKKKFSTEQTPTKHREQSNNYGTHAQFYKTALRNPWGFLKAYKDQELSKVIKDISVVARKEMITFDRGGSFHYEKKRVRMQPIFMCITFDLTKVENRKSSATKKSFAFFLAPDKETLRKNLTPPQQEI